VGTLPQELSSLQLTGEPVMVQKRRNPQATNETPEETERSTV